MQNMLSIPQEVYSSCFVPGWNLGDVQHTSGIADLIDVLTEDEFPFDRLMAAHFQGNYGYISNDLSDLKRTQRARMEGRLFTGIWFVRNEMIKIVTNPALGITTVCLASED